MISHTHVGPLNVEHVTSVCVCERYKCVSLSDLFSAPSGYSLGCQPQDLRQQLAVFVPAESHPVGGRGGDARRKHRLMEGLLQRNGVWRGWGQKQGTDRVTKRWKWHRWLKSTTYASCPILTHIHIYLYYRLSPLWHSASSGTWEQEQSCGKSIHQLKSSCINTRQHSLQWISAAQTSMRVWESSKEWLNNRLGLAPLWLCSVAPPCGSGWLLRPERSASTVTGFLATQKSPL